MIDYYLIDFFFCRPATLVCRACFVHARGWRWCLADVGGGVYGEDRTDQAATQQQLKCIQTVRAQAPQCQEEQGQLPAYKCHPTSTTARNLTSRLWKSELIDFFIISFFLIIMDFFLAIKKEPTKIKWPINFQRNRNLEPPLWPVLSHLIFRSKWRAPPLLILRPQMEVFWRPFFFKFQVISMSWDKICPPLWGCLGRTGCWIPHFARMSSGGRGGVECRSFVATRAWQCATPLPASLWRLYRRPTTWDFTNYSTPSPHLKACWLSFTRFYRQVHSCPPLPPPRH